MANEEKTTPASTAAGCGCALLFWAFIILFCSGIISAEKLRNNAERTARVEKVQAFLTANDSKVKVLGIYTVYNNKGHATGQSAVLEGVKSKERWTTSVYPKLPVAGETWKCEVTEEGYLVLAENIP